MIDKLEEIKHRFEEVGQLIVQPDIMTDMGKYSKLSKEYKDLEKIVVRYGEYKNILDNIASSKEILSTEKDPEFREMAKMELEVLRSRIYEIELQKHNDAVGAQRKSMVGSGDRSDKIRTYNYPQGRVTDHRIGYSQHNLPTVMDGEIGEFIEQLRIAENAEKLKEGQD